eukprot:m.750802 g.750802  ORF g.750802 m.750802 type:complete len:157 (-) comp58982_c0_seq14:1625-2095(-)
MWPRSVASRSRAMRVWRIFPKSMELEVCALNISLLERFRGVFSAAGLVTLAFPCNQFGAQEPGSNEEIKAFIKSMRADVQIFQKTDVNGKSQHPIYRFLKSASSEFSHDIEWNFAYFIVNRNGHVVKRLDAGTPLNSREVLAVIDALVNEVPRSEL